MAPQDTAAPKGLPSDFEWGFATASYQIEGGVNEGGRGPSIWDIFTHLEPSRTNGANGDVACDHYHRYEEDLNLLAKYGAKADAWVMWTMGVRLCVENAWLARHP